MMNQITVYEKHSIEIILLSDYDVFATAWFGSDIDGDAEDEFSIKPTLVDS